MAYLLESLGRGLLAELAAAFRDVLPDDRSVDTAVLVRRAAEYPDSPDAAVRLAIRRLNEWKPVAAREGFTKVLAHDARHLAAALGLACAQDAVGLADDALSTLGSAVRRFPDEASIHFAIGFCREKLGDLDRARESYLESLDCAPQLRNAYERLAAIALRQDDYGEAIEQYERLCWLEPGDIDFSLTLAALHRKAGRFDEAIRRFQFALTIDPDNWEAQSDLASAYVESGDLDKAATYLESLISEQPEDADAHLRLGDIYARLGDCEQAEETYRQALAINHDSMEGHIKLGTLHLREGRYLDAAQSFNRGVELNDRLLTAYVGLGVTQFEMGDEAEAAAALDMAGQIEPNSTLLFAEMCRLQLKTEAVRQSARLGGLPHESAAEDSGADLLDAQITRHRQTIERYPHYADLHYRLGLLLRHRGETDEAIQSFHRALTINPNYVKALIKLGLAYRELGEWDISIDVFRRVLAIDPQQVEVYYQLGLIYADREHFELAVEHFDHAVRRDPQNVDFRAQLALALQDMNLVDRADATWQGLCEVAPDTAAGRDLLVRLSRDS